MSKLIVLVLITLLLSSCSFNHYPIIGDNDNPFVVKDINIYEGDLCYYISTQGTVIIAERGLFDVNDTINFVQETTFILK